MRYHRGSIGSLARLGSRLATSRLRLTRVSIQLRRTIFSSTPKSDAKQHKQHSSLPAAVITGGLFIWWLYPSDDFAQLSNKKRSSRQHIADSEGDGASGSQQDNQPAWVNFARRFEAFTSVNNFEWPALPDKLVDFIAPEWSRMLPGYMTKLQRELSMSPGSLADEIWSEAHDPLVHPEIRYSADVRVSSELCDEEKTFLSRRRRVARIGLAKYLGLKEEDVHPDDVPTIAMCGSGGGLRALIAGTGSLLATEEDGLFDCVTYTSGVSGSCWLQALNLTSFNKGSIQSLLQHLKSRASTHIAYPPDAFQTLISMPTNKYLLSGMVEKLKGDPHADFGLVDVYGVLLAARYLVPKGDLGVNDRDFKLSNQREYIQYGQLPMPIYTAVRHEIPNLTPAEAQAGIFGIEKAKDEAQKLPWFQWYEITPYEFFCEEFGAGIPTWALGRRFNDGRDVPPEYGFHLPEIRLPLLMGVFGSAFCATLSHYYREIKPVLKGLAGFGAVDGLISGRDGDLSKVHPFDPAKIPNFAYGMHGKLPQTTPDSIYDSEYIQLMDAGMSNNLPIYPLLRPGRDVDVLIAFDASADIKVDNWLSVADGYARQRGIKGWPLGIGWPKAGESSAQVAKELEDAQAKSAHEAESKLQDAKEKQNEMRKEAQRNGQSPKSGNKEAKYEHGEEDSGDLGYCTVWVGTNQERTAESPRTKAISEPDAWKLMEPDAGITVVYLPFLTNDKVPGLSPGTTDFLSTWNFIYTPDQIDKVVQLARANYDEGKDQIRSTVRAVYERKKRLREATERTTRQERYRSLIRRGEGVRLGQGDQFS
ncbi:acyl transferase/acyl hydrolase/lysophospholipase [Dactylonectria macrodidyma]|uniref:Lysophospholipase n=1 Tax=Dactylonectria macrodidyma TaxID=307937 RepID=A0A9P9IV62_9HYPO|nr:acyl transferase/acyl hydrolase/lysophospholipase [Dactylonectria macrodidyma]